MAIPADLVSSVQYYDIEVNDTYIYIAYNGCTDTSGSSSKYKSCIAKYNKDGTFVSKTEIYTGSSSSIAITKVPNNKVFVILATIV